MSQFSGARILKAMSRFFTRIPTLSRPVSVEKLRSADENRVIVQKRKYTQFSGAF